MKIKHKQAVRAASGAQARQVSADQRDAAFRRHRDAERAANEAKTERLKKLRLAKEAMDRAAAKAGKA